MPNQAHPQLQTKETPRDKPGMSTFSTRVEELSLALKAGGSA